MIGEGGAGPTCIFRGVDLFLVLEPNGTEAIGFRKSEAVLFLRKKLGFDGDKVTDKDRAFFPVFDDISFTFFCSF